MDGDTILSPIYLISAIYGRFAITGIVLMALNPQIAVQYANMHWSRDHWLERHFSTTLFLSLDLSFSLSHAII